MNGSRLLVRISQKFLCLCHANRLLNSNAIKCIKLSSFTCQARSYSTHADVSLARKAAENSVIHSATCDVRGKLSLNYLFWFNSFQC